jgi:hypothetical protein
MTLVGSGTNYPVRQALTLLSTLSLGGVLNYGVDTFWPNWCLIRQIARVLNEWYRTGHYREVMVTDKRPETWVMDRI